MTLTVGDIVQAVAGRLVAGHPSSRVDGFSINSRTLEAGELFVAIPGPRFDGHAFVEAALRGGACGALVSSPVGHLPREVVDGRALIVVPDSVAALQRLARWVRRRSGARVVAITGSAGKTTTKEATAACLGLRHEVMRSVGNLNNHIGLPLSLLELRHGAGVAVVELGMNHSGEISRLVSIAEPDVRVWTNVAEVHTEFFASIDAIADAKAEVLEGASAASVLVANADDPRVMARVPRFPGRTVTFGVSPVADIAASEIEDLGLDGTSALVSAGADLARIQVPLLGRGNLLNVLAALAVGRQFDVPFGEMAGRVASLEPAEHRGHVLRLGEGVVVVDDAYNSNPRALQGALAVVAKEGRFARRVAVIGEMLELGREAQPLHEQCGRAAAGSGLGLLITVGGEPARALGRSAVAAGMDTSAVHHASSSAEAADLAAGLVRPGDLVLVKGSHGIHTERVVERLAVAFRA
jgi:UDP-N-acetylmuramoyl-tripeptide--D-alanyl-D-alanine ligase